MSSKLGFCCLGPVYMTWLHIWCIEKRSLEHSPTRQGKILGCWRGQHCLDPACLCRMCWYIQGGNSVFLNASSSIQSKCVLHRPSAGRRDSRHLHITRHEAEKLCFTNTSDWAQSPSTAGIPAPVLNACICLLICNTGIKPLPDHQLIRILQRGKSVGAPWHHTKVERHGGDVMRRQIIIYAVSVWMLFSPFTDEAFPEIRQMNGEGCRRCSCFQTTLGGGRSDIPRGSHDGTVLRAPASERHCLKRRKHLHHTTKASCPAPRGPAEKQPHRRPGCPQAPAGSSVTAIAWQQAHGISAHQSSSAVFLYINMLKPVNIRNIGDNVRERPMQVYLSSRIIYADVGTIKITLVPLT